MGYLLDALRALETTMTNVFRPAFTVQYPEVIRPRSPRLRVSFALPDDEHGEMACIGCLACERICPSHVISMKSTGKKESPVTGKKRAYVEAFTLDLTACIQCELCIQVCNSDAITMVTEAELPGFTREDLVLDIDRLRANARNKTASWGKGVALQEMQEGAKPKPAPKKPAAEKKPPGDTPEKIPVEAKPAGGEKPVAVAAETAPTVDTPSNGLPVSTSADAMSAPSVSMPAEPVGTRKETA